MVKLCYVQIFGQKPRNFKGETMEILNFYEKKGVGADFTDKPFPLTSNTIDESIAVTKTAEEVLALLADKDAMAMGEVYRVTEPIVLNSDTNYYGNLAAIIAEGGVEINNADSVVVKELIIKGSITVTRSSNITFFNVDVLSCTDGITLDEKSSNVSIKECRISAEGSALKSSANLVSVLSSYMAANKGIVSTGDELAVQSSQIDAKSLGVSLSGADCAVKNNTITAKTGGVGVSLSKGAVNGLVALNVVRDAQTSISVTDSFNCVVLLNSATTVEGKGNTNLYVVKNDLGDSITLKNNKYLLCDENFLPADGKEHVIKADNSEFNGNNLQDVTERPEYGANEEILPHTNKDLFVGMERKSSVRDISAGETYGFNDYIRTMANQGSVVIVPPGAYTVTSELELDDSCANTTIYAYGVYEEKKTIPEGKERPDRIADMGTLLAVRGADINIHGLTMGYDFQSAGQVYALEKWEDETGRYVRVVTSAGNINEFANSNTRLFKTPVQVARGDMSYSWVNYIGQDAVTHDTDGTMIIKMGNGPISVHVFNEIKKGDVFGCRLAGENGHSIQLNGTNTLMKDCVLYGYTAALAFYSWGKDAKGIRLERVHNTNKSSPVIDKETYDRYKALEEKYGMTSDGEDPLAKGAQGLEVYVDSKGRYRGGLPRYGSVDALHVNHAAQGISVTSCTLEHMVDDAINQRSNSSRVAGVVDNGDGTTTIYIKGSLAQVYFHGVHTASGELTASPNGCSSFSKGDRIFAYGIGSGKTLVDAEVLSASEDAGVLPDGCHMVHVDDDGDCICDICGTPMHTDVLINSSGEAGYDCKCDKCGKPVHTSFMTGTKYTYDGRGEKDICNGCGADLSGTSEHVIRKMATAGMTSYDPKTSTLTFKMLGTKASGEKYIITFNTKITKVTVKTTDVDFSAVEGIDFTDNDYFMKEKIACDNISMNSANFTVDNVLMQEFHSRGLLLKTRNVTAKNCTLRSIALSSATLAAEGIWGESTVSKNITIEGCLFDNTSHTYTAHIVPEHSPILIQGLGAAINPYKKIAENNLPCENIKIIGNKFINTNNNQVMTITDAQNVDIKNNIIECRTVADSDGNRIPDEENGKAIYIQRCINIDISGNTFECCKDKLSKGTHIVAWDYKNLTGTDLYDAEGKRFESLPTDNAEKRP